MPERIDDAFNTYIEVYTHNDVVIGVSFGGVFLNFDASEVDAHSATAYRNLYENGTSLDVLAVETEDE